MLRTQALSVIDSCLCLTKLNPTKLLSEHTVQVQYVASGTVLSESIEKTNPYRGESLCLMLEAAVGGFFFVIYWRSQISKTLGCSPTSG